MRQRRSISFEIRHHDQRVAGGSFVVSSREAVSHFDSDRIKVVVKHCLIADGSVSLSLEMYELEDSQPGGRRKQVLRAGISMGSESGEREPDSVMLGEEHELIFKTEWLT
jgi:hypothetical protein